MMVAICRRLNLLSRRLNFWKIAFLQSQPPKIAKPQSRHPKIHQNSLSIVTPEQYSHFSGQKKWHPPLSSERHMPQKWLKHGLLWSFLILFSLVEPLSPRGTRWANEFKIDIFTFATLWEYVHDVLSVYGNKSSVELVPIIINLIRFPIRSSCCKFCNNCISHQFSIF